MHSFLFSASKSQRWYRGSIQFNFRSCKKALAHSRCSVSKTEQRLEQKSETAREAWVGLDLLSDSTQASLTFSLLCYYSTVYYHTLFYQLNAWNRLDTTSNMCNTLTIDFQDLMAPKGAVLWVVQYTRYFTRRIVILAARA